MQWATTASRLRAMRILRILLLSAGATLVLPAHGVPIGIQLTTTEKNQLQREARFVVDLLQNQHYSGRTFHEIENQEILNRFIGELDPQSDIFTAADAEFIHRRFDRSLRSVYLFRGDLQPAFEIFDLFAGRARERLAWVGRRLDQDFDFTVDESYTEPAPAETWAQPTASALPAERRWELRLKDQMLHRITLGQTPDEARATLHQYYAEVGRSIATMDSLTVRERFLDAAIRSFDPHSGYFSADSSQEFAVGMQGAVTGLGIDVLKKQGRCVVAAVQPGGPADLYSSLTSGDSIEALAQGNGPWVETDRRRLREIVALMRGAPGEKVRVAYRPEGTGEKLELTLERAEVVLAAGRARGAISDVPDEHGHVRPIGWVVLPAFYADAEDTATASAAADVRELLDQMAARKIEGLVIDLRGNPGGALSEAVAMSHLFLRRGPVLFTRGTDGKLDQQTFKEDVPAYAGPLVLLTSPRSASAAEVFAGALKYHHRALIVGAQSTFGKGTAQAYVNLAKAQGLAGETVKDWGTLRMTFERIYLPDGSAVQRTGVTSQIVLPDFAPASERREADLPHALPADSVTPPVADQAAVTPAVPEALLSVLTEQAAKDVETLPEWKLWIQEQASLRDLADRRTRSLQAEVRRRQWDDVLAGSVATQRTRRDLARAAAYPTQPLEISAVKAAQEAHEGRLRARAQVDGPSHLRNGVLVVETDHGHLRELSLQAFDFTSFLGDTEALAEVFSHGSGQAVTAAELRAMLQRFSLLEDRTTGAVLAAAARIAGKPLEPAAARQGTEALLRRAVELDPELRRERPALDVPLRECLRLGAAWADLIATPPP
jgi:carboxyl-terminal processing protease